MEQRMVKSADMREEETARRRSSVRGEESIYLRAALVCPVRREALVSPGLSIVHVTRTRFPPFR